MQTLFIFEVKRLSSYCVHSQYMCTGGFLITLDTNYLWCQRMIVKTAF